MTEEKQDKAPEKVPAVSIPYGVGLDIGTMNFVSARRGLEGIQTKRMRDVFIDLPKSSKKMLKLSIIFFHIKSNLN